jgi:hypothetical protein
MSRIYGDLGATYGAHASKTYGELFDSDLPPTSGLVALFARVPRSDVLAEVNVTSIRAQVTTMPVDATIN